MEQEERKMNDKDKRKFQRELDAGMGILLVVISLYNFIFIPFAIALLIIKKILDNKQTADIADKDRP